jgi:hypothetical protein
MEGFSGVALGVAFGEGSYIEKLEEHAEQIVLGASCHLVGCINVMWDTSYCDVAS